MQAATYRVMPSVNKVAAITGSIIHSVPINWHVTRTLKPQVGKHIQLTRNLPPRTSNVQGLEWRDHFGLEPLYAAPKAIDN